MYLTDVFFFIDLVMCFFTTIEDRERMTEVTDIKAICKNYLSGWFSIDFVSILPLDRIVNLFLEAQSNGNNKANSIIRVLKIGKIYKLIRCIAQSYESNEIKPIANQMHCICFSRNRITS